MQSNMLNAVIKSAVIAAVLLGTGVSSAADVYLRAQAESKDVGNGLMVPTWGFVCDPAATTNDNCTDTSAGAQIDLLASDTLTIYLDNTLPVPVSIFVPGLIADATPETFVDGQGQTRVRSFVPETAANATGMYEWTSLRPGTFLFQSGTQPSLQVPMGLFGALVVNSTGTEAYPGIAPTSQGVMLLSEVDPIQNDRLAAHIEAMLGPDGTGTVTLPTEACVSMADYVLNGTIGYPCSIDYNPMYFLVNGEPTASLPSMDRSTDTTPVTALLRLLNAGQRTHTPSIVNVEMGLVAQDGNRYPGSTMKWQSEALLAAGKTMDVLITAPKSDVTLSIFDRMPTFSNENAPNGGSLATAQVGLGTLPPPTAALTAVADNYAFNENSSLAGLNLLDNDIGAVGATASLSTDPTNGTAIVNADGTFTYVPDAGTFGPDTFTYTATLGLESSSATVTIDVGFTNDAPVARDDTYTNAIGADIVVSAPGVLANDTDVDGDTLTATLVSGPTGFTLDPSGSFTYTGTPGVVTFTYTASDGALTSDPATVELTINPVANIALNVVEPDGTPVSGYHWTVEEDTMFVADPAVANGESLATNFHRSYMPVVAQGDGAADFAMVALDPAKHYYVSVLPLDAWLGAIDTTSGTGPGHAIGGARILPGATSVTVTVNMQPTPYAQMSIFVFNDNAPTNGAVDGGETGLGGFQITLEDAGGRYGISGGTMSQDADGNPLRNALADAPWNCFGGAQPPVGIILSCPDTPENQAAELVGEVLIQNLYPGKYGVIATAPTGESTKWVETTTIEGTNVIDAWVKANEPPYFQEFGPAGWHVFVGFVNPEQIAAANVPGPNSISGAVTNMHMSRPPDQTLWDSTTYDALAHTQAWVGLNSAGGIGPNVKVVQANADGSFTLDGIPDGDYQVVIWDTYLDQVIAYSGVVPLSEANSSVDLGTVPVFNWFTRFENNVFLDDGCGDPAFAGDGIRQDDATCVEQGMSEQNINLRWRDGTVNQAFPTDLEGFVPFDEAFPFFHWQVIEVDYARFKPTGVTVLVDGGGDVAGTGTVYNPQVQADGTTTRTETGPVLTQGFQGFLGQTSILDWGKMPYAEGENGGISGIVYYASTRAENDPRLGVGEPWEPGVARVKVRLYKEVVRPDGTTVMALLDETETDAWDDNLPSGCPGAVAIDKDIVGLGPDDATDAEITTKCYDGLRNFNQIRPGVFDGGYAFGADGSLAPGKYVVEVVPPPGYTLVKEEDVNVGFGDTYGFEPTVVVLPGGAVPVMPDPAMVYAAMQKDYGLAQPPCVGEIRTVPDYLSLFPDAWEPAPFAQADRPLCDRKEVIVSDQGQAAADFFLATSAPIAGHFVGMILDDIAQEFNPLSPQFGEKWAPPFVPVSVRDYTGHEISRTYSDQWGRINGLLPSTFSANLPSPSGYSPAMLMTCMNDPGPIQNPANPGDPEDLIVDPQYNPAYSNFCYTFQYMPGTTTYLDTPVLPVSAYASGYNPVDCAAPAGTPVIRHVDGTGDGPLTTQGGTLTIYSQGMATVSNPAYEGPLATGLAADKTITRNFGFGATEGTVSLTAVNGTVTTLDPANVEWTDGTITWTVPGTFANGIYQLEVTTSTGETTTEAITVEVRGSGYARKRVPADYPTIQAAVDAASDGDLILVSPGTYDELVILWKPVRLQGAGAGATFINAVKRPTETLVTWREKMDCLFGMGANCGFMGAEAGQQVVTALPNQPDGAIGFDTEEGAAITVVGVFDANGNANGQHPAHSFRNGPRARIDGFSITGGDTGGGIFVNGNAHRLQIGNNRVFGNSGSYHGGIRVGRPFLELLPQDGLYDFNRNVDIHHNAITQNGALDGAGGGVSLATGTDNYAVTENFICGNFVQGDGGGIGHLGLSDNGTIANNRILFNQSFLQGSVVGGGGVFIGGETPAAGELPMGSGDVTVDSNLIKGNQAASGNGGGIRTQYVNGQDVINTLANNGNPRPGRWWTVAMTNNMVVNNVAGGAGGGISLQDTARSFIVNNTVANNDSTATVAAAFTTGDVNLSASQPAGISSELHTATLTAAIPERANTADLRLFSNPGLANNIVWRNRSFHYDATTGTALLEPQLAQSNPGDCVAGASYWDLGVLGGGYSLNPTNSVLTDTTGYAASNTNADPALAAAYCNGGRALVGEPGPMFALPALDEGGNTWIEIRFGPLTQMGDYHIAAGSSAIDAADGSVLFAPADDFDGDARPQGAGPDSGADEIVPAL